MSCEDSIKEKLLDKFRFLEGKINVTRRRRIFIEVDMQNFPGLLDFVAKEMNFSILCTITGLDEGNALGLIYHLAQDNGIVLNIKTAVSKANPIANTIMPYFPGAEIYERELVDLLGFKVEGLPAASRYPLTDDWPLDTYPLRKDFKNA